MRRLLFDFLVTNFFAVLILAQSQPAQENQPNRCGLWGSIVSSSHFNTEGMRIELVGGGDAGRQTTRVIRGAFDFQSALPGIYHVRVIDHSGKVVLWKTHSLKGIDDFLIVYLPYSISEPSLKHIVSLTELKHKIPQQAQNAFRAAVKAEEAGDLQKSIEAFKKALTIDPQFAEAEINLAVQFDQSGQSDEAIVHAQKALELRSGDPDAARTLMMLLFRAKRYEQIETVARTMLANQRAVPEMHEFLAISLIGQRRNIDEAFAHLEVAVESLPIARLLFANTLVEAGLPKLAVTQIDTYLKSSTNECERESLEHWVAIINHSRSTMAALPSVGVE